MAVTRAEAHAAMNDRIVDAARALLADGQEVSLRAVARSLGVTAPALYRYAASHEDLVRMVAVAIDADVGDRIGAAAAAYPDDPAAAIIAAAVEFRRWALSSRREFSLVFTNVDVSCIEELHAKATTGMTFSALLAQVWERYRFPIPRLDEMDPSLAEIMLDPMLPADLTALPDEMRGLVWVLQQAWSRLYGTVTLEVFEHIDPRMVEQGHLFRSMVVDQAGPLGLTEEIPRLRALLDELL